MGLAIGVGLLTFVLCVAIQSAATGLVVAVLMALNRRKVIGIGFGSTLLVLEITTLILAASSLAQMACWGGVLVLCGELPEFESAFYHSAMSFTTLGYGDIVLSDRWRMLAPLEAANGVVVGGLGAALLFEVMNWLAETKGKYLRTRATALYAPPQQGA